MAVQWLVDAGLIYKVERCKAPELPLKFYVDNAAFKIYLLDVGLLAAMSQTEPKDILLGNKVFSEFKGAFSENYVLQQLKPISGVNTYYFSKDNSQLEIDFLLQCAGRIIPVEVKSEENVKSKSLHTFVDNHMNEGKGLRISMKQHIEQDWMENIPLCATAPYFEKIMSENNGYTVNPQRPNRK